MEIVGSLVVASIMALIAAFVVQAVKQIPVLKPYHDYIPIPLALVLIGVGVLLAFLQGGDMVQGGIEGFIGAALAIYGYEFVTHTLNPSSGE